MSSYDHTMREAGDNDAVAEPTQPAAEHTAQLPKRYAVTVRAYGVHIVDAESSDAACAYVASLGSSMTHIDSDWYLVEIDDVQEEKE